MSEPLALSQGDIVLVRFPYTDQSAAKVRPAVVISNDSYHAHATDVIVCGVTSNLSNSSHSVLVGPQDLESGVLPRPSRVKVGKVLNVHRSILRGKIGRLNGRAFAQVMREFESIFS